MKAYNPHSETLAAIQCIAMSVLVITFVLLAGFAFHASLYVEGCISLFMAWLAPKLLGESDE